MWAYNNVVLINTLSSYEKDMTVTSEVKTIRDI